ncbi:MAG TPA: hypothetical protein VE689_12050 [Candidatus Udaeobacter sp.]|nr:hypothetical protein [Candidatus Udaeobacter sp.]
MSQAMKSKTQALYFIVITTALAVFLTQTFFSKGGAEQSVADPSRLPGIQTRQPPWIAEIEHLFDRLQAIHLPALSAEGNALHIHQHLDLILSGTQVSVPADIGINYAARFISPIHTHDETGVIHVESDEVRDFTLGEFFDVWGVRFTKDCIGGYCSKGTNTLKVFVNGKPVSGDPRKLVLQPRQEIVVIYGAQTGSTKVPSSYLFPPGT